MAGGLFICLGAIGGFVWGARHQAVMTGVLLGTGAGIAAAVLVWLVDLARR
jgi:hypothetical protein